jgi:hypothetical protein
LHPTAVEELVKRTIILLSVYQGYDDSTDSVLQTLSDVCEAFIHKICLSFRAITDTRELRTQKDISDNIETVFSDIGFPLQSLRGYVESIAAHKNNLVNEVTKKYGPLLGPPKQVTPLEMPTFKHLDLVVGLEETDNTENVSGKDHATWEKSLSDLGIISDPTEFIDFDSLGT